MSKPIKSSRSPYWQYDFTIQGRRFYGSTGQTSLRAAQKFIERKRREVAEGPVREEVTVDEAFGLYWEQVASEQPSAGTTKSHMQKLLVELGANKLLSQITQERLIEYSRKRRQSVAVSTANRELQTFRRIRNYTRKSLRREVGDDIDYSKVLRKEPPERVRELSREEEQRLFMCLRYDFRDFVAFCMQTGVRISGACNMRWDDVDLENRSVRIRNKGGDDYYVPLTTALTELLGNQPRVSEHVWTYEAQNSNSRRNIGVRYPIASGTVAKPWRQALKAAGITNFRFHDLRHTAASRKLRASGNLKAVQKMLGHSQITTTARYAHSQLDDVRDVMEKADEWERDGKL